MKKADKLSEAAYEFADLKPGDSCIISNRTDYVMSLLRGGMNDVWDARCLNICLNYKIKKEQQ